MWRAAEEADLLRLTFSSVCVRADRDECDTAVHN